MSAADLAAVAKQMVSPGRGVLAADESNATITKRFAALGIESTFENRRAYRDTLFSTPGVEDYVSGVILYDETIRQSSADGTAFPQLLADRGMLPGIKVDTGAKDLPGSPGEMITEGLDGLPARVAEYVSLGAKFAKWRAVITIGDGIPTDYCIHTNAHALARYAKICQEGGLVPIVEPEVLMDADNTIETCFDVTQRTHRAVFAELAAQGVALDGIILKPNMVISGKQCSVQAPPQQVADETLRLLYTTVLPVVPGVAFLSGGQSASLATEHLDLMNKQGPHPWKLSFSYGRALQNEALNTWKGATDNVAEAQKVFTTRTKSVSAASEGTYDRSMEPASA